jgi:hypothetical protein
MSPARWCRSVILLHFLTKKKRKTGEGDASLCTVGSDLVSRIQPSFRIGAVRCSAAAGRQHGCSTRQPSFFATCNFGPIKYTVAYPAHASIARSGTGTYYYTPYCIYRHHWQGTVPIRVDQKKGKDALCMGGRFPTRRSRAHGRF